MSTASAEVDKTYHMVSGFLLEKTAKKMKLHFSRMLLAHPKVDITVDQWIILDLLYREGALTQQDLAESSLKDAPTVTRILDILQQKKYIRRLAHPNDRRKFVIDLMENGKQIHALILPLAQSFRKAAYQKISNEEMLVFSKVLHKIQENLSFQP
jgi:DNA-binding MarR family transcriptional regulator